MAIGILNNSFLVLGSYLFLGSLYLFFIPLFLCFWMNTRWNFMGKYERLLIYGLVFLFFPGLILFAPFLNLRMSGQGDRWVLTKANVLQLGLVLLILGVISYGSFILFGFDEIKAGIASQALLVLVLLGGWVMSYFFEYFLAKWLLSSNENVIARNLISLLI